MKIHFSFSKIWCRLCLPKFEIGAVQSNVNRVDLENAEKCAYSRCCWAVLPFWRAGTLRSQHPLFSPSFVPTALFWWPLWPRACRGALCCSASLRWRGSHAVFGLLPFLDSSQAFFFCAIRRLHCRSSGKLCTHHVLKKIEATRLSKDLSSWRGSDTAKLRQFMKMSHFGSRNELSA